MWDEHKCILSFTKGLKCQVVPSKTDDFYRSDARPAPTCKNLAAASSDEDNRDQRRNRNCKRWWNLRSIDSALIVDDPRFRCHQRSYAIDSTAITDESQLIPPRSQWRLQMIRNSTAIADDSQSRFRRDHNGLECVCV